MTSFDWDKWNLDWAKGLLKNPMWSKIRTGEVDENGEPTYRTEMVDDEAAVEPVVAEPEEEEAKPRPRKAPVKKVSED